MENKYFVGIDPIGYDGGSSGSLSIMKRDKDSNLIIVCCYKGRNTRDYEEEFKMMQEFYKSVKTLKENGE